MSTKTKIQKEENFISIINLIEFEVNLKKFMKFEIILILRTRITLHVSIYREVKLPCRGLAKK